MSICESGKGKLARVMKSGELILREFILIFHTLMLLLVICAAKLVPFWSVIFLVSDARKTISKERYIKILEEALQSDSGGKATSSYHVEGRLIKSDFPS